MALTGLDLAMATQPALLLAAGITGMLGAASVDLGPFASVEQAVLAEAVPPDRRNVAFARYSLTGGLFNAAGDWRQRWRRGPRPQRASSFCMQDSAWRPRCCRFS